MDYHYHRRLSRNSQHFLDQSMHEKNRYKIHWFYQSLFSPKMFQLERYLIDGKLVTIFNFQFEIWTWIYLFIYSHRLSKKFLSALASNWIELYYIVTGLHEKLVRPFLLPNLFPGRSMMRSNWIFFFSFCHPMVIKVEKTPAKDEPWSLLLSIKFEPLKREKRIRLTRYSGIQTSQKVIFPR